ncbi:MAG: hypothetical protein LBD24_01805 [Spirochaetaceae bacterium]|nr:hypothetical protein [Spirochaetaceae bacterium]
MSGERVSAAQARLRFAPSQAVREPCVVVRSKGRRVVRGGARLASVGGLGGL